MPSRRSRGGTREDTKEVENLSTGDYNGEMEARTKKTFPGAPGERGTAVGCAAVREGERAVHQHPAGRAAGTG